MKSRHTNIKLITEAEKDNQLAFINVNTMKQDQSFLTGIYRKPTFSCICTNYSSLISSEYKTGLVTRLLERCCQIASSYEIFHS